MDNLCCLRFSTGQVRRGLRPIGAGHRPIGLSSAEFRSNSGQFDLIGLQGTRVSIVGGEL